MLKRCWETDHVPAISIVSHDDRLDITLKEREYLSSGEELSHRPREIHRSSWNWSTIGTDETIVSCNSNCEGIRIGRFKSNVHPTSRIDRRSRPGSVVFREKFHVFEFHPNPLEWRIRC